MWWKKKIIFPFTSIILIACLFTPYFIKIGHGIFEHKELRCVDKGELHIHEIEFDCDFHKFQISSLFYLDFERPELFLPNIPNQKILDHYTFLSKYQKLHFVLRGPPAV